MKTNIEIRKRTLSEIQRQKIMDSKNTINLTNKLSDKELVQNRARRKARRHEKPLLFALLTLSIVFMVLIGANIKTSSVNAHNEAIINNVPTNAEYAFYGVDNFRDYARKQRLEACQRVGRVMIDSISEEQIVACATTLTLITAIESANMTSRRCVQDNNCMGIKGWTNGQYGFMKFDSQYKGNLYFAKKWFRFHYKKSLRILVFGYRQADGSYKYGWTYTQQDTYYAFLVRGYNGVKGEIEALYN